MYYEVFFLIINLKIFLCKFFNIIEMIFKLIKEMDLLR